MNSNEQRQPFTFTEHLQPLDPSEIDEYGFARAWQRTPVDQRALEHSEEYWPYFEKWCRQHGFEAFPASVEIVLDFLRDPSVSGNTLYNVWGAIHLRHDAYYWHTDANPAAALHNHVTVEEDGTVQISDNIMTLTRWGVTLDGPYVDPHRLQSQAGVYIGMCSMAHKYFSLWRVLQLIQTDDVQAIVSTQIPQPCFSAHCRGRVYHAALYDNNPTTMSRLREAILQEQSSIPC